MLAVVMKLQSTIGKRLKPPRNPLNNRRLLSLDYADPHG